MKTASRLSHRKFLLGVSADSVAATAAVATATKAPRQAKKAETMTQSKSYHVTEHILKYYNTTKI